MDSLASVIMKIQESGTHIDDSDITSAKLLINDSVEELTRIIMNLENVGVEKNNVGVETTNVATPCNSKDLANALLP
jgi:hypothetical protein